MRFTFIKAEVPELQIEIDGNDLAELLKEEIIFADFGDIRHVLVVTSEEEEEQVLQVLMDRAYNIQISRAMLFRLIREYEITHTFAAEPMIVKIKLNTRGR